MQVFPRKRRGRPPKFSNVWGIDSQYNKIREETVVLKEQSEESVEAEAAIQCLTPHIIPQHNKTSSSAILIHNDITVNKASRLPARRTRNKKEPSCKKEQLAVACDSLRKFFEAGGRDYNDYLKLKNTVAQISNSSELLNSKHLPLKEHQLDKGHGLDMSVLPLQDDMLHILPGSPNEEMCLSVYLDNLLFTPVAFIKQHENSQIDFRAENGCVKHLQCPILNQNSDSSTAENTNCCGFKNCQSLLPEPMHLKTNVCERSNIEHLEQITALDLSTRKRKIDQMCIIDKYRPTENDYQKVGCDDNINNNDTQTCDIRLWDVGDVVDFVSSVPGCSSYAEVFLEHSIDGATLLHLAEDHMVNFIGMKLGPAIRLKLEIKKLKDTIVKL